MLLLVNQQVFMRFQQTLKLNELCRLVKMSVTFPLAEVKASHRCSCWYEMSLTNTAILVNEKCVYLCVISLLEMSWCLILNTVTAELG